MSTEKLILTDVDGVLLSWDDGFATFMGSKGHAPLPNSEHFYRLSKRYPEFTDIEMTALVEEFNTSPAIAELNPWADSVEYVRKLSSEGYKFICITAISEHPDARYYRDKNLKNVFGKNIFNYQDMICISPGKSKRAALSKWMGSGYYWIEDHFLHAESGYELGLQSILMDSPQNQHFNTDLFPRVSNWRQIYEMITNKIHVDIGV